MSKILFSGMRILAGQEWLTRHALIVQDKKIIALMPDTQINDYLPAKHIQLSADDCLVPGFIDLHVHGVKGCDVMDGTEESLRTISTALAEEGVTGFLATTMTASVMDIDRVMRVVSKEVPGVLGVHLEGPFIAKDKCGAQRGNQVRLPDIDQVKTWQQQSGHAIKLLTLAPELAGALDFIEALRALNIRVSIGHTNATYAETNQAIQVGCTHATHLFNAMRGISQREPGAAGALLLADNITAELIADHVHLHPAILELAWRVKGKEKLVLVTDAMRGKCLGDGAYDLGGQAVHVSANRATLQDGTLAGSVLRMPDAIRHFQVATNCKLEEAIQLASLNPAKILGLSAVKGSLAEGKDADGVVLDENFNVQMTLHEGEVVFQREAVCRVD